MEEEEPVNYENLNMKIMFTMKNSAGDAVFLNYTDLSRYVDIFYTFENGETSKDGHQIWKSDRIEAK